MKKLLILLSVLLLLTACNSNNNTSSIEEPMDEENIDVEEIVSDEEFYLKFLQEETGILEKKEIIIFIKDKFHHDKTDYIILATGQASSIERVFILTDRPNVELIGEINHTYIIDSLSLIKFEGSEENYIYCALRNSADLHGFLIYSIVDGELHEIVREASASGAGFSEIFDNEGNGYINGYTSNRWSYDVLYHESFKTYLWEQDDFRLTHHSVDLGVYPDEAITLVSYFIELHAINDDSEDIDYRLKEIFPTSEYYSNKTIKFQDILENNLGMENYMVFKEELKDDKLRVIVTNGSEALSENYKYIFNMYEEFNKWHILSIELVE